MLAFGTPNNQHIAQVHIDINITNKQARAHGRQHYKIEPIQNEVEQSSSVVGWMTMRIGEGCECV